MAHDSANTDIVYDELRPSQLSFQSHQYGGPHKVVPAMPLERQMTDAEKLKADKEQLKLK